MNKDIRQTWIQKKQLDFQKNVRVRLKGIVCLKCLFELCFPYSKFIPSLIFTWNSVETQSKREQQYKNYAFQGSLLYHN